MQLLKNINRQIERVSGPFLALALLAITIILCVNVVGRYVFGFGLPWAEELTTYTIIWITLIGGGHCVRRKLHVSVDILPNFLSGKLKKLNEIFIAITGLSFSLILVYYGGQLALGTAKSGQLSPAMMLPMYVPYGALVIGGLLMVLEFLQDILTSLFEAK